MSLENLPQYPDDLNALWPVDGDSVSDGDAHLRGIKTVIQNAFKLIGGTDLSQSFMTRLHPVGSVVVGIPTEGSRPQDDYEGTWLKLGVVAMNNATKEAGTVAYTELWIWQRTA